MAAFYSSCIDIFDFCVCVVIYDVSTKFALLLHLRGSERMSDVLKD